MAKAVVGDQYRHCKGGEYEVLHLGFDSGTHKEVVVYQSMEAGKVWVRDREEFEGRHSSGVERFVKLI